MEKNASEKPMDQKENTDEEKFWNHNRGDTAPVKGEYAQQSTVTPHPIINSQPDPDVVAAYRASTANAYAAAAARGLWRESDKAKNAIFERAAANKDSSQPAAENTETGKSNDNPAANVPNAPATATAENSFAAKPQQPADAVSENTISLEDILANVKALEERIFAEAAEADKSIQEKINSRGNDQQ